LIKNELNLNFLAPIQSLDGTTFVRELLYLVLGVCLAFNGGSQLALFFDYDDAVVSGYSFLSTPNLPARSGSVHVITVQRI